MADRVQWFFKQRITEAELNSAFDDFENADLNLAKDASIFGIITGAVLSEDSPPSFDIFASNPATGYDQLGRRIRYDVQQQIDASIDEVGNPTLPAAGNKRFISIVLEFDRTLADPRVDGNGNPINFDQDESFKFRVINGVEVLLAGTAIRPSKPTDALLVADILLLDSTTDIQNADFDITRRDDFVFGDASTVSVVAGAWTKIDSSVTNVQTALDSVDVELISRDGSGGIDQDLLPDATDTRALGSAGLRWNALLEDLDLSATGRVLTDLIPKLGGQALGSNSFRWNAFLNTLNLAASGARIVGAMLPDVTSTNDVGSTALRWKEFFGVTYQGNIFQSNNATVAGGYIMNAPKQVSQFVTMLLGQLNTAAANNWVFSAGQWNNATPGLHIIYLPVMVPEGVTLQGLNIRWSQGVNTAVDMVAQLIKIGIAGTEVAVGSATTIAIFASVHDATIGGALAEVIDRGTNAYWVRVTSSDSSGGSNLLVSLRADYDVDDIGAAAVNGR